MKIIKLIAILFCVAISAHAQNTTNLPPGTIQTTPQFRIKSPADSLRQTWLTFPFYTPNRFYSATELNQMFRSNSVANVWIKTYVDSLNLIIKDSVLNKHKNLLEVDDKLTAYKNLNGYAVSFASYGVSPDSASNRNAYNLQRAIDENPDGTVFYGNPSDSILIDTAIYITNRKSIVIKDLQLISDQLNSESTTGFHQINVQNSDKILFENTRHYGNSALIDDNHRGSAITIGTGSKNIFINNIIISHFRQNGINIGGGGSSQDSIVADVTVLNAKMDSIYRDGVSISKAKRVIINGLTLNYSQQGGAFEYSDSADVAIISNVIARKCFYAFDIDEHDGTAINRNLIIDKLHSISNNYVMYHGTLNSLTSNFRWTNFMIDSTATQELGLSGSINGLTIENWTIKNSQHNNVRLQIQRPSNLIIKNINFMGPQTNRLIRLHNGTMKNIQIDGIVASSYVGTGSAILIANADTVSLRNCMINGVSNSQNLIEIQNCNEWAAYDNTLSGTSGYGIYFNPISSVNGAFVYNNRTAGTAGVRFMTSNLGNYQVYNSGTFSKQTSTAGNEVPFTLNVPVTFRTPTTQYASVNFPSGTAKTTPVSGDWENLGGQLKFHNGTGLRRLAQINDVSPANGQIPIGNGTDFTSAAITSGNNVSIANTAGAITINSLLYTSHYMANGDGISTTITIPHGLTGISSSSLVWITPKNTNSAGYTYTTTDATNINILYPIAPPSGTNNLSFDIQIKP